MSYEVGQQVYVGQRFGWNAYRYALATVSKITPSGLVKTRINEYEQVFNADGKERGKAHNGCWLDSDMSLVERSLWIQKQNAISQAISILRKLDLRPQLDTVADMIGSISGIGTELDKARAELDKALSEEQP